MGALFAYPEWALRVRWRAGGLEWRALAARGARIPAEEIESIGPTVQGSWEIHKVGSPGTLTVPVGLCRPRDVAALLAHLPQRRPQMTVHDEDTCPYPGADGPGST